MMTLGPRESGKLIASLASHITLRDDGIKKLGDVIVEEIKSGRLSTSNFSQTEVHPKPEDPWCIDWLFVVDTLNFCFWSAPNEPSWTVDGYTGYFALCAAINRAIKERIDIANPKFYASITEKQLLNILRSDTTAQVPLISERVKCLHEVGECLLEKYDGSFKNVVEKAENSAATLLNLIVSDFKCFKDEAVYKGHKVAIYKRAQILVGDIWACFQNRGLGKMGDIEEITMFADYRVPQSLLYYGVFEYSPELSERLKREELLQNGEEYEVEIRGCSIHAVEVVKDYVKKQLNEDHEVNSILIDHYLWDFRRKNAKVIADKGLPFHKVLCIYY